MPLQPKAAASPSGHGAGWGRVATVAYGVFAALAAGLAIWRPALIEDRVGGVLADLRFRTRGVYWRLTEPNADWRERARAAGLPTRLPRIVVVAVDDASIVRFGGWPWPRSRVAELIERIQASGPAAIAVGLSLHDAASAWDDARIAKALGGPSQRSVVAVRVSPGATLAAPVPELLRAAAVTRVDRPGELDPPQTAGALPPADASAGSAGLGHSYYAPGRDGRLRYESLYVRYGDVFIPSLALQAARVAAGVAPGDVRIRADGRVEVGATVVPSDRRGRLLINYYGNERSLQGAGPFPRYSAAQVLSREVSPSEFASDVVFIGGTADIATVDFVDTPFADGVPLVEKDATVAANILAHDFLHDAPAALNLLAVLAVGVAVPLLCHRRRAALSLLSIVGVALALGVADMALFLRGVSLALAYPLLLLLVAGGAGVARQFLAERRVARRMRRLFSSYVTERVVERLIADPAMARLGGEHREVSILFVDIRGFTGFSERHPPERVVATLNEYLGAMTEVVFRWEGTLDKFIGDTILAFWGAPLPQEDHAERALRCALHLCARLDGLNAAWAAAGRPVLEIGVGVTTGTVLVGNIGAEGKKMDYTVIGDQVNLCSRIEELTKSLAARILIAAGTFERLRPLVAAGRVGHLAVEGPVQVVVKGREGPVGVYRVTPREHGAAAELTDGRGVGAPA